MGQQQLLLIVLGVIIVGIAIVVGINLFNANAVSSNRDAIISDLNNLGALAQQYYQKPTSMAGGGNTFTGWDITKSGFSSTANGAYTATVTAQSVTITGVSASQKASDGSYVTAVATVNPTGITVSVTH